MFLNLLEKKGLVRFFYDLHKYCRSNKINSNNPRKSCKIVFYAYLCIYYEFTIDFADKEGDELALLHEAGEKLPERDCCNLWTLTILFSHALEIGHHKND